MNNAVLILSGGMDSATLLWDLKRQGITPVCLSFNYGQRHKKELICAAELATAAGADWELADLTALAPFLKGSSQTDASVPVPEGKYDEPSMKLTVVPNRNMIMLSVAIAFAIGAGLDRVYYGAHAGDHAIYPDCRPEFVTAMKQAAALCDWKKVTIEAPYLDRTKGDICKLGLLLTVPFQSTWTCYKGGELACGKCGSCSERLEAFAEARAIDPLAYDHAPSAEAV